MGEYTGEVLEQYVARQSGDSVKRDLELIHEPCGTHICDIEPDDTLSVLAAVAADHECPGTADDEDEEA